MEKNVDDLIEEINDQEVESEIVGGVTRKNTYYTCYPKGRPHTGSCICFD